MSSDFLPIGTAAFTLNKTKPISWCKKNYVRLVSNNCFTPWLRLNHVSSDHAVGLMMPWSCCTDTYSEFQVFQDKDQDKNPIFVTLTRKFCNLLQLGNRGITSEYVRHGESIETISYFVWLFFRQKILFFLIKFRSKDHFSGYFLSQRSSNLKSLHFKAKAFEILIVDR